MNNRIGLAILILGSLGLRPAAALDEKLVDEARLQAVWVRGLDFTNRLPVKPLTPGVITDILSRELEEEYDGGGLDAAQELYTRWLGILPDHYNLREGLHQLMQEQVAGLYDPKTKVLYVTPEAGSTGETAAVENDELGLPVVMVHELQHALEDQHFDFDSMEKQLKGSDDSLLAYQSVVEGSATRGMLEAMPAITAAADGDTGALLFIDNLLRLPIMEWVFMRALSDPSKLMEAEGVKPASDIPDLMYMQLMLPYTLGYQFTRTFSRDYGSDALDHLFTQPPQSTEQLIHPDKYWEWRDLPTRIALASNLPATKAWSLWHDETVGEADVRLIFDQHLGEGRGTALGRGWDGGRIGLYRNAEGKRLMVWEMAWDSVAAARRFEAACARVWAEKFQARPRPGAPKGTWMRPDGRAGLLRREGARVQVLETDATGGLSGEMVHAVDGAVRVETPDERKDRDNALARFNPVLAFKRDADYWTLKALGGVLWRHDHNAIGARDQVLAGWIFRSTRSKTYRETSLLHGWLVKHRADARKDHAVTTFLPWGLALSDMQTRQPTNPGQGYRKISLAAGLAASYRRNGNERVLKLLPLGVLWSDEQTVAAQPEKSSRKTGLGWGLLSSYERSGKDHSFRLLPWGLLFRHDLSEGQTTVRVLGVPVYRN